MKALSISILIASLMAGGTAIAKDRGAKDSVAPLSKALSTIAATATAQGPKPEDHFKPKNSNGQGPAHANPEAILRVCSKDTPAAHRAAICAEGASPN